VAPEDLAGYVVRLENACRENPRSADLRTCLGMAYAMSFEAYKSMDALELAREIDPEHFFAQFKYAELLHRLRALPRAREETERALELARNPWELALARQQLQEIRRLMREGTQKPAWTKPLLAPAVGLLLLFCFLSLVVAMR
jgi:cytochrome c-type biogenesis protein CcmH/NrfG